MPSENQCKYISKDGCRRDTARRSRQSARQSADQTAFVHCFFHTLRKRIAKAEKRRCRTAARKGNEWTIHTNRCQSHTERNV